MEEIQRQVSRAQRRMVLQQFGGVLVWTMFAVLLVATIGVAIPKIWVIGVDQNIWQWSWVGGSIGVGLIIAMTWTYLIRFRAIDAAVAIDQRYGLKERVASSLSLQPDELDTEFGQALMSDTSRRVQTIDMRQHFGFATNWRAALPFIAALAMFLVFIQDPAISDKTAQAKEEAREKKQVEQAQNELKKKIEKIRKKVESNKNLKDAEVFFKDIEKQIDEFSKGKSSGVDRKSAMVKLNDIKKQIDDRKKQIGDAQQMRKHLNQLKDMKKGPADKAANAIKNGDFNKALDEIDKLQQQLKNGELTDEQKKQLAEQLEQMAKKLDELAKAHQHAKEQLKKKIEEAKKNNDMAKVDQLQQQLDQLQQQDQQMNRLQQMANKMAQAGQQLKQGGQQNLKQAAKALDEIGDQLAQMQAQMDELQTLDEMMDQLADAKNAMNCKECAGAGCRACMLGGQGMGQKQDQIGFGLGDGVGQGERPDQETDKKFYNSKVGTKPQAGQAVRTGVAGGPNIAGMSREEVRSEIAERLSQEPDPLTNQRLPRKQREHARDYFKTLSNEE